MLEHDRGRVGQESSIVCCCCCRRCRCRCRVLAGLSEERPRKRPFERVEMQSTAVRSLKPKRGTGGREEGGVRRAESGWERGGGGEEREQFFLFAIFFAFL